MTRARCVFCLEYLVPDWLINGSEGRHYFHDSVKPRHTLWPTQVGDLGGTHECPAVDFILSGVVSAEDQVYCEPTVRQWITYIRGANAIR